MTAPDRTYNGALTPSGLTPTGVAPAVPRTVLAATFLVSGSLLLQEVSSTRLFSVATAYHFAVLSVSLAMLGLSVGGVLVQVARERLRLFGEVRAAYLATVAYAATTLFGLLCLLGTPIDPVPTLGGWLNLYLLFLPQALPYMAAGIALSILLAAYTSSISRLYFADLAGAGLGCLGSALLLPALGGGGTILAAALLGAAGAACLAGPASARTLPGVLRPWPSLAGTALLVVLHLATGAFELTYVKGRAELPRPDVRWTAHSRVGISPEEAREKPFGWGFGRAFVPTGRSYPFRRIRIDGLAETPVVRWDGRRESLDFLLWDVTSFPYLLKPQGGRALVIGSGGGRDVLAARAAGDWEVDAVEINEGIAQAVLGPLAAYSGDVYRLPGVGLRVLDGRSAVERCPPGSLDLVQLSAVDTWAAGSSGAFALMENGLYTVEAFGSMLRCLKPDGHLSVSRFRYPDDFGGEVVRMTTLGAAALERSGVARPAEHMLIVANGDAPGVFEIATLLARPTPFTAGELEAAARESAKRGFQLLWPAEIASGAPGPVAQFLRLGSEAERERFYDDYPIDVRPTVDDRPFFFHQMRLSKLAGALEWKNELASMRLVAVLTVLRLALFLLVMSAALVVYPMTRAARALPGRLDPRFLAYFIALGGGFMLYEIPLIQQLTLGLGHPSQALSVALFGLLVGTSLGSLATGRVRRAAPAVHGAMALLAVGLGLAAGAWGQSVTRLLFGLPGTARVAAGLSVALGAGVILGTLFPLGVRLLSERGQGWGVAWCWAANGAAGVLGSVLALLLGVELGMTGTFLTGAALYLVAALAVVAIRSGPPRPEAAPPDRPPATA